ncbi:Ig-like domain-containing protein [Clostridium oryzae]|uniref:Bacterial Ig-like domain protein n=1 Tax=Clostridium oryzae TaxID=1450648 RepID=A0A1V4IZ27_9CLOT|nr:Ig-like domain-containing protein [Clostridium oryzae]OPJ65080.1 bacterial Ig-like domain protein [Clostridium oryzae]
MKKNANNMIGRAISAALALGVASTAVPVNAKSASSYYNAAQKAVAKAQKSRTQKNIDKASRAIKILKARTSLDRTQKVKKLVRNLQKVQNAVYNKVSSSITKFGNSQDRSDYTYSKKLINTLISSSSSKVNSRGVGFQKSLDAARATVLSVAAQNAKTVDYGTPAAKLALPTTVVVTLSNGDTAAAMVKWNTANYNGNLANKYTLTGTLSLPNDKYYKPTTLTASIDVVVKDGAFNITSVNAVGARKIQVKFNKQIDTGAARIDIRRNGISINILRTTYSADRTSAVIELPSKISKADYAVTIWGLNSPSVTRNFTGEDERVSAINILSDSAPVDNASNIKYATVGYKVTNQYGEDITSTTYLRTGNSSVAASNGVVTIYRNALGTNPAIGNKVVITLINAESGVAASKMVTLTAPAAPSVVSVDGLYNKDGKQLSESTNLSADKFYLLLDLKDQYGNPITSASAGKSLVMTQTNTSVVQAQTDSSSIQPLLTTINVNGNNKLAVQLKPGTLTAGESTITFICPTSGYKASYTVRVAEGTKADTIILSQPSQAIAGEDLYIPVSVIDRSGYSVTDVNVLNSISKGVNITFGGTRINSPFILKDNKLYIYIRNSNSTPVKEGYSVVVAQSSTSKVSTLPIKIEAAAKPSMVKGLKSTVSTTILANRTKGISIDDLIICDQYGRVMTTNQVRNSLNSGDISSIKIVETDINNRYVNLDSNQITKNSNIQLRAAGSNGTEGFYLSLMDRNGREISSSTAYVSFRVTDGHEYRSYSVDPIGTVYDETAAGHRDSDAYDKPINVYGILNDGTKVQLAAGLDYTVTSANPIIAADVSKDSRLDADHRMTYDTGKTTTNAPVTVTINSTGQQLTQNVVFSNAAPQVTRVSVVNDHAVNASPINSLTVTPGSTFGIWNIATGASGRSNIVVTDQYGVSELASSNGITPYPDGTNVAAPSVVIVPTKGTIKIVNNGLSTASASEIDADDQFNVTIIYSSGQSDTVLVTAR